MRPSKASAPRSAGRLAVAGAPTWAFSCSRGSGPRAGAGQRRSCRRSRRPLTSARRLRLRSPAAARKSSVHCSWPPCSVARFSCSCQGRGAATAAAAPRAVVRPVVRALARSPVPVLVPMPVAGAAASALATSHCAALSRPWASRASASCGRSKASRPTRSWRAGRSSSASPSRSTAAAARRVARGPAPSLSCRPLSVALGRATRSCAGLPAQSTRASALSRPARRGRSSGAR